MRYNTLIFDTNNLYWRSWLSNSKKFFKHGDSVLYSGGIEESFERIKHLLNTYGYKNSVCYFLFDNPFSAINIRKIISEGEYKHPRQHKNAPAQLYKTLNIFRELLKSYSDNFRVISSNNLEADDLTRPILNTLGINDDQKVLCISADMDWARNIDNGIDWYNWNSVYNAKRFKKKYGFSPLGNAVKLYKAIHGDPSDNIPNAVPHLPKKILIDMVESFDDMRDLLNKVWYKAEYPDNWKKKIQDASNTLKRNYSLVDFIEINEPIENLIHTCKRNEIKSRLWFEFLGLRVESWMTTKEELDTVFFKPKKHRPRRK